MTTCDSQGCFRLSSYQTLHLIKYQALKLKLKLKLKIKLKIKLELLNI